MRTFSRVTLVAAVSAALVGSIALPATAAPTADTTVTVLVEPGVLSVSVPAAADLGTLLPGGFSEVTLTPVQVSDTRAGVAPWSAGVIMGNLVGGLTGFIIPSTTATYTPTAATVTGTSTVTPTTQTDLSTAKMVQAAAVSGNNTASWDAVLRVTAPAGTYTATMTHSFL